MVEHVNLADDSALIFEESERLLDRHVENVGDGLSPVGDLKGVGVEAGAIARLARRLDVGHEVKARPHRPLTGAFRDALFMSRDDVCELGLRDGEAVSVRSETGEVRAHVHVAPIRPRNVQMFFPEANPLIAAGRRDEVALVPDYNAVVEVRRASDATGVRT